MSADQTRPGYWVYPRVHGGNKLDPNGEFTDQGLSPRTRGKRPVSNSPRSCAGSIPAYTGETGSVTTAGLFDKVYPRVHGGNCRIPVFLLICEGLSPRTRGKRDLDARRGQLRGSIPAYTGETVPGCAARSITRVYPRVHGGNRWSCPMPAGYRGLSPRTRGKPKLLRQTVRQDRSIPAYTGETVGALDLAAFVEVYPRVHGGNSASN